MYVFFTWQNTRQFQHCECFCDFEQAELNDQRKEWKREKRSTTENATLYLVRFLINILVLGLLGGALYLITFTAEQMIEVRILLSFWILLNVVDIVNHVKSTVPELRY